MPRIDDYINARQIAFEKLSKESFDNIVKRSGFETLRDNVLKVPFLDRVYQVSFPDFEFKKSLVPQGGAFLLVSIRK